MDEGYNHEKLEVKEPTSWHGPSVHRSPHIVPTPPQQGAYTQQTSLNNAIENALKTSRLVTISNKRMTDPYQ